MTPGNVRGVKNLLLAYRVMATVVGVLLIVLVLVGLPLNELHLLNDAWFRKGSDAQELGDWISRNLGVAHGWRRIEPPMVVTKSQGTHIFQLDGQPALDVLLRHRNFHGTADEFFARGMPLQPLGIARRSGEDIRVLHAGDDEERSVWGTAEVPQGALVWLMEADRQALLDGAAWSCTEAVARLDGLAPLGVLAFDCAGRRAGLAEGGPLDEEVRTIRTALSDAPFAGFYTLGEIARVRGALGLHHLTLVTLAVA